MFYNYPIKTPGLKYFIFNTLPHLNYKASGSLCNLTDRPDIFIFNTLHRSDYKVAGFHCNLTQS